MSFEIGRGETVALVGESGSGKSVTALSIMQLLPYPYAHHPSGSIKFDGEEVIGADEATMRKLRGEAHCIIFQEPMTSLNPLHTIEKQVGEVLQLHKGVSREAARARVIELLNLVGLPEAEKRLGAYPHQLSGGQRQRVMIAMALANEPDLLIADEPTTALDVTIQAQIMKLLEELKQRLGMSMLLITHDLNIVRRIADRVCVMTDGEIVEQGTTADIFENPQHEYTRHLLEVEPKPHPSRATDGRAGDHGGRQPQGVVPDQARRAAPRGRPHQGGRRRHAGGARRAYGRGRRRVGLGQDHAGARAAAAGA